MRTVREQIAPKLKLPKCSQDRAVYCRSEKHSVRWEIAVQIFAVNSQFQAGMEPILPTGCSRQDATFSQISLYLLRSQIKYFISHLRLSLSSSSQFYRSFPPQFLQVEFPESLEKNVADIFASSNRDKEKQSYTCEERAKPGKNFMTVGHDRGESLVANSSSTFQSEGRR